MKTSEQQNIGHQLAAHAAVLKSKRLVSFFQEDPDRIQHFSWTFDNNFIDFSKNFLTKETLELFQTWAQAYQLPQKIQQLFAGNFLLQGQPSGLHFVLRAQKDPRIILNNRNIHIEIQHELYRIQRFVQQVIESQWCGFTGKPITDVINIGIGGSDLGPALLTEALTPYQTRLNVHFVSNGDGIRTYQLTQRLNPETTLLIIVSKTFTTQETLLNAKTLLEWLQTATGQSLLAHQVIGVSANAPAMKAFGIPEAHQFHFWDFVGGRFSIWSSVGLAAALAIGFDHFAEFLAGGASIDAHFLNTDIQNNIPVIMALLDIFYIEYWQAQSKAVLPYHAYLKKLPAYLQQLSMESLGKSVNNSAETVDYPTGQIIWGDLGSNGQHAFYQLLHQGTLFIPVEFIVPLKFDHGLSHHTQFILANALGQAQALMQGQNQTDIYQTMQKQGFSPQDIEALLPYRVYPGNRPSTMILLSELTPKTMGQIIALYEHKVFVQSIIWDINPYDQWGVELGKTLAKKLLVFLENDSSLLKDPMALLKAAMF